MANADQVDRDVQQLATWLLRDVERIAGRSTTRIRESIPEAATIPIEELHLAAQTNTRNVLQAVLELQADPIRAAENFLEAGEARTREGITVDSLLQAWRIGLECLREEAYAGAEQLGISDRALLEFVEATLRSGDLGRRITARAQREEELRELKRVATEQTSLRRVATMVASASPPEKVFTKVAKEVGMLLRVATAAICRYELDGYATLVGVWGETRDPSPVGTRLSLDEDSVAARVYRTARPVRMVTSGTVTTAAGLLKGPRSAVGSPVVVNGRPWGAIAVAASQKETLPADAERRIAEFTELVATSIANVQAREEVRKLVDEQAALRRVATLVAQEVPPGELFGAVAMEVGTLFGVEFTGMVHYEPDLKFRTWVATWAAVGEHPPVPARSRITPEDPAGGLIVSRGSPVRVDDWTDIPGPTGEFARKLGAKSSVASPILVNGNLWGGLALHSTRGPLPAETESRLLNFTELLATAIANAEARSDVQRLAEEQAALRRVATLVAHGATPFAVFDCVASEVQRVLGADGVTLSRYEPGDEVVVLAHHGPDAELVPPGTRASHADGESVTAKVWRSERPARFLHVDGAPGAVSELAQRVGVRAAVGAPIMLDGRLWGLTLANWRDEESPPSDTEEQIVKFTELLATAIANVDSRDQLTASRVRLVTEGDNARRRVVRDLHDGAQQRFVHTIVTLKHAQRAFKADDTGKAESLLAEALDQAQRGNAELRELAHGILPAVLTQGGIRSGVNTIVSRLDLPITVDIPTTRFPAEVEASAYFVVAEALTNVLKHSQARRVEVNASTDNRWLYVTVSDDGVGGADPHGHGLLGIADRLSALGGRLQIQSPDGGGTLLSATLPRYIA